MLRNYKLLTHNSTTCWTMSGSVVLRACYWVHIFIQCDATIYNLVLCRSPSLSWWMGHAIHGKELTSVSHLYEWASKTMFKSKTKAKTESVTPWRYHNMCDSHYNGYSFVPISRSRGKLLHALSHNQLVLVNYSHGKVNVNISTVCGICSVLYLELSMCRY